MNDGMRGASWLLLIGVGVVMAPGACDDSTSAVDSAAAGPGSGPGGPGGGGPGGSGALCGDECTVACDAPPTQGSGECIEVSGPIQCNPITNDPCTDGRVCDFGPGGFQCYAGDNSRALCDSCNATSHCAAGLTCSPFSVCTKFCCGDGDCGAQGKCEMLPPLTVGTCHKGAGGPGPSSSAESSGPASSSASSGAGGDGGSAGGAAGGASSSASTGGGGGAGGA